MHDEDKVLGS